MSTEPWEFTETRWRQRHEDNSGLDGAPLPFRCVCLHCHLPALVAQPTKRRKWMARCETCGARAFTAPQALWGLAGIGRDLWSVDAARIGRLSADRRRAGDAVILESGWQVRDLEVRRRRTDATGPTWSAKPIPHLRGQFGCLWCGEPASAVIRLNQLGQPQVSCSACQTIVHSVRPELVAPYVGWSVWLQADHARGAEAWRAYRAAGKRRWLDWSGGLAESTAAAAVQPEEPAESRRRSS